MASAIPCSTAIHFRSRSSKRQRSRMFWADYHYLCHFIETGEGGAAVFDRFFDAETSFERLSPRYELVDLREFPPAPEARKVVVV